MKIAIRVDASSLIGTGHFMRCLTIANALSKYGAQVSFLSYRLAGSLTAMLKENGHHIFPIDSRLNESISGDLEHSHWLGTSQRADARACVRELAGRIWDWLIVDHYALDVRWEAVLRQSTRAIAVIDDLANRQHDCDVLLDQNFYENIDQRYINKVPEQCRILLGPRYALLRDEFRKCREQLKPRTGAVKRVLVFFGGVDKGNYTHNAIEALIGIGIEGLHVDVVIGALNPHREEIKSACTKYRFDFYAHTDHMAELMAGADLAIGAGGSAIWERCCLGLPTFSICTADNQNRQICDAAAEGLLYSADIDEDLTQTIRHHLYALVTNYGLRVLISRNAMKAVDGRGTLRVVRELGLSNVVIRVACQKDSQSLFTWRNHPNIRAMSRTTEEISWEDHQKWFTSVLGSSDRVLLIAEKKGMPVGVIRFDVQDAEAEVSIYAVPTTKEVGLGQDFLRHAERWVEVNRPEVGKIRAHVLGANNQSHNMFLKSGYKLSSSCYLKRLYPHG